VQQDDKGRSRVDGTGTGGKAGAAAATSLLLWLYLQHTTKQLLLQCTVCGKSGGVGSNDAIRGTQAAGKV
jgi:hypothetical protein